MRARRGAFLVAGGPLAVAGLAAAAISAPDPASRMGVLVLGAVGLVGTFVLGRSRNPDVGTYVRDLMLLGVGLRLVLFALVHQTVGPYVFAPDQFTYEGWGQGLVRYWDGLGIMPRGLQGSMEVGYPMMNGLLFVIFGYAPAAPAVINVFLSAWVAVPVHRLALLLSGDHGTARWSAALTVLFPSLMLWSVLNIREASTIFVLVWSVYFFVRLQRRPNPGALAGLVVSLVLLLTLRDYITFLVAAAGAMGILMGKSHSPVRTFAVGLVVLFAVTYAGQSLGLADVVVEAPLEQAQTIRQGFFYQAASAYGEGADISTATGALSFLPVGLTYFLLAPFPWSVTSLLQVITLPETLLWYGLIPFGVWGAFLACRHRLGTFTVPLTVLILVTFAYALVEGNVGTAYRHRAQILPLIFIFCALGVRDYLALRSLRRERRREVRARARGWPRDSASST